MLCMKTNLSFKNMFFFLCEHTSRLVSSGILEQKQYMFHYSNSSKECMTTKYKGFECPLFGVSVNIIWRPNLGHEPLCKLACVYSTLMTSIATYFNYLCFFSYCVVDRRLSHESFRPLVVLSLYLMVRKEHNGT